MTPLEKAIDKASEILSKREDENEYHLHDVDRKWVIEAMMDYAEYCLKGTSSQTEISDEEIDNYANSSNPFEYGQNRNIWYDGFIEGFNQSNKWYREQLKSKGNG